MKKTRLKYVRDGALHKAGPFITPQGTYTVTLDLKRLEGSINLNDSLMMLKYGNSTRELRRKVKQTLRELGVHFYDELRNKGKTQKFEV